MSQVLSRPVIVLTLAVAVVGMNSLLLSPIAAAIGLDLGAIDAAQVMVAAAAFGMGTAFSAFTLAAQADRIGAERALALALCTMIIAMGLSATAQSLVWLVLGQTIAGLAAGVALPACYALGAQVAKPGYQAQTLGVILFGWTISMVGGVTFSAFAAELFHWRAVFASMGLAAALLLPMVLRTRHWGESRASAQATPPWKAFRVPGIARALLICFCYMSAFYGLYNFAGPHITDVLGHSTALAALLPLGYGIGFGVAVGFDHYIDRWGQDRVALALFPALAGTYALCGLLSSALLGFVALTFVWGFLNHLGLNLVVGRLTALDPTRRAAILGLYSTVTYLAVTFASVLFKPIFDAHGLLWCGLAASGFILIAALDASARAVKRSGTNPGH